MRLLVLLGILLFSFTVKASDYVFIYTTDSCHYCTLMKDYMKSHNIKFIEKNIEKDLKARQEYDRLGVMGVPITIVNGTVIEGYDIDKLKRAVK